MVEERDVERSVVNDDLGVAHERLDVRPHIREPRLVLQKLAGNAVHLEGSFLDIPIGLQVVVKAVVGQTSIHQLDATDLDDSVAQRGVETGRLGVEHHLSHAECCPMAERASLSAFSLPS